MANQPRGNALLVVLCLIVLGSAAGFMMWGFKVRQSPVAAPVTQPATEIRGTKISDPVAPVAPTNAVAANANPATTAANTNAVPAVSTNSAANLDISKLEKITVGEGRQYFTVGFDYLSGFEYAMPDESSTNKTATAETPKDQIPKPVRSLNNQRIALKGFMLPLKVEGGLITELLVMRDQSMCCYGAVPKINEWVSVKMTSKGVKPIMDQAVTIYGTLKVGEIRENGYLVGIYEMDGDSMAGPLDL